jgi:D-alanyl-D-alanine carboxypeptidase
VLAALVLAAGPAYAAKNASIVIDANTGRVLFSEDANGLRYPASLTKMMTLYLVFEALQSGKITMDTPVTMTRLGAAQAPSKLGLRAGKTFTVEQGILSLVTRSANDVAMSFAEFLGGSEDVFGRMMTAKARALGMRNTVYVNPNGLPDKRQVTTARDQALLGMALRQHYPQYYSYFSVRSFRFGKQVIGNHNHLLGKVAGVDGIKTGYTGAAGFNLATSAIAGGHSIVVVTLGQPSTKFRDAKVAALVKRYLPASSDGGRSFTIARGPQTVIAEPPASVARVDRDDRDAADNTDVADAGDDEDGLPNAGPVPGARYGVNPLEVAYADTGEATPAPVVGKTALAAELKMAASSATAGGQQAEPVAPAPVLKAPTPSAPVKKVVAPAAEIDNLTTASTKSEEDDEPETRGTPEANGWIIQVGTAQNAQLAKDLLQTAQDKGGKVLRSANPYTIALNDSGAKVYRARFSGFRNQDTALKACKVLKRKGVGCWASEN